MNKTQTQKYVVERNDQVLRFINNLFYIKWKKRDKVIFNKVITIKVPYCPKCGKQISEVTDVDARTIHYDMAL